MATAIQTRHYHHAPRPPWMRRQPPQHDTFLAMFMVAIIGVSITAILLSAPASDVTIAHSLIVTFGRSIPTRPLDGAGPMAKPASPAAIQTIAVAPQEPTLVSMDIVPIDGGLAAPVLAVGRQARVVNTEGVGVVLRGAPQVSARQPAGLFEGTTVTILELAGSEWARVQSDSKQSGWVPTAFLAAAD